MRKLLSSRIRRVRAFWNALARLFRGGRASAQQSTETPVVEIEFTEAQRQIIGLRQGRHLVLAPPGTGKTELLAQRMLWAVGQGVDPRRMLCLTFTVRAARNMEERIARRIQARLPVTTGNVHSFCAGLLRRHAVIPSSWVIIDDQTQQNLMEEVLDTLAEEERRLLTEGKSRLPVTDLIGMCGKIRQMELEIPDALRGDPRDHAQFCRYPELCRKLSDQFRRYKEEFNVIDFEDILAQTYIFLVKRKALPEENLFAWAQVDEVQDLSPLQWAIIEAVLAPDAHCVYLGDREQAIFSFMGASQEHLQSLAGRCRMHNMSENFRSPGYLLEVFVKYARNNLKPLWRQHPLAVDVRGPAPGDRLILATKGNEIAERARVVRFLQSPAQRRRGAQQTAILLRDNKSCDDYAAALEAEGMKVFKVSGADLMDSEVMLDIKALFAVLARSSDRIAWGRLIRLFGGASTQRAARRLVKELHNVGICPPDLLPLEGTERLHTLSFAKRTAAARVVVFDTETTGLAAEDDIIQIAAQEVVGGVPGREFARYLKTARPLGDSYKIHGISMDKLSAEGVEPTVGLCEFMDFVGGSPLVAHNASFDIAMLRTNLGRRGVTAEIPGEIHDTLDIARRLHPGLNSHSLESLIKALKLEGANTHDARDDVRATVSVMLRLGKDALAQASAQETVLERYATALERWAAEFAPFWRQLHSLGDATHRRLSELLLDYLSDHDLLRYQRAHCDDLVSIKNYLEPFWAYTDSYYPPAPAAKLARASSVAINGLKGADLLLGDEPYVVSTIHKAKGLEFDTVIIPRCTDDVFPHYRSQISASPGCAIAEEARLLYVAMTRARRQLVISYHTAASSGRGARPSRFLAPIAKMFET